MKRWILALLVMAISGALWLNSDSADARLSAFELDISTTGTAGPSQSFGVEVDIINNTLAILNNVTVTVQVPENTSYVAGTLSSTAATVSFNAGTNEITWTGTLVGTVTLDFDLRFFSDIPCGTSVSIVAEFDDITTERGKNAECPLIEINNFDFEFDHAETASDGDRITYEFTVTSTNHRDWIWVLTHTVPDHATYVPGSASTTSGDVELLGDNVRWRGPIPANGAISFSYQVDIDERVPADCMDLTTNFFRGTPAATTVIFGAVGLNTAVDCQDFCDGQLATIEMATNGGDGIGTAGNDVIIGTIGADIIDGLDGDDTICGLAGNDQIQAGPGVDRVLGGPGNDRIFGAQGADHINGDGGDDTIHGNRGADILDGDAGDDRIFGYSQNDTINGGTGDDRLHGNFGDDTINGGTGNDRIFGYGDDDELNGDAGDDLISGNFGNDTIDGGDDDDELFGADGDDILHGGNGNDILNGNSLNDTLNGGPGNDTLDGGINTDLCNGNTGTDTATRCEATTGIP